LVLRPHLVGTRQFEFALLKKEQQEALDSLLRDRFSNMDVTVREDASNGQVRYVLTATESYVKYLEDLTMDQALKTIRNRIDQFGVAEPDIRKQQAIASSSSFLVSTIPSGPSTSSGAPPS
jgi:hypothetical protein